MSQNSSHTTQWDIMDTDEGESGGSTSATASAAKTKRKTRVKFTVANDVIILADVLRTNPFKERGRWKDVADHVSNLVPKRFSARNVRERVDCLLKHCVTKPTAFKKKVGSAEEYSQREQLLRDVKDLKFSLFATSSQSVINKKSAVNAEEGQAPRDTCAAALTPRSNQNHNSSIPPIETDAPMNVEEVIYVPAAEEVQEIAAVLDTERVLLDSFTNSVIPQPLTANYEVDTSAEVVIPFNEQEARDPDHQPTVLPESTGICTSLSTSFQSVSPPSSSSPVSFPAGSPTRRTPRPNSKVNETGGGLNASNVMECLKVQTDGEQLRFEREKFRVESAAKREKFRLQLEAEREKFAIQARAESKRLKAVFAHVQEINRYNQELVMKKEEDMKELLNKNQELVRQNQELVRQNQALVRQNQDLIRQNQELVGQNQKLLPKIKI